MAYKLIILAPSCGGKSTLMRYLREHSNLDIAETDEEVMGANNNIWPSDHDLKNKILIPLITKEIIKSDSVIFFASYIPEDSIREARDKGFKVALLDISMEELIQRNKKRMQLENYQDATPWFAMQLDDYEQLKKYGLIDVVIDGTQTVETLAEQIVSFT
jgi:dephospho-CoA kinase